MRPSGNCHNCYRAKRGLVPADLVIEGTPYCLTCAKEDYTAEEIAEVMTQNEAPPAPHVCGVEGCTNMTSGKMCDKCRQREWYRKNKSTAAKEGKAFDSSAKRPAARRCEWPGGCKKKLRRDSTSGMCRHHWHLTYVGKESVAAKSMTKENLEKANKGPLKEKPASWKPSRKRLFPIYVPESFLDRYLTSLTREEKQLLVNQHISTQPEATR